jgi:hypothetical protein
MFWVDIPPVNSNIGISDIKKKIKKKKIYIFKNDKCILNKYLTFFSFAVIEIKGVACIDLCIKSIFNLQ